MFALIELNYTYLQKEIYNSKINFCFCLFVCFCHASVCLLWLNVQLWAEITFICKTTIYLILILHSRLHWKINSRKTE